MTEKQLIAKIRELGRIEPRKDWVSFTKERILGEEPKVKWSSVFEIFPRLVFQYKFAFVATAIVVILIGVFSFVQNSLPGELLYPLKKITERGRAVFVSEEEKPKLELELANKRLEELTKIAESNQMEKLAPALQEYQTSIVQATKNLNKAKDSPVLRKEIAQQTQKLEEKKQILEKVYGVAGLEKEEEESPTKIVVEWLIKDLENRSLTEAQQELLIKAKEYFKTGDYFLALEKLLEE